MGMPPFYDLYRLSENERIDVIGKTLMDAPQSSADKPIIIGLMLEDDAKCDRYMKKLQKKFPGIREIDRVNGPVPGTKLLSIGQPLR